MLGCTASALTVGHSGVPTLASEFMSKTWACYMVESLLWMVAWVICLLLVFYYEVKEYKSKA